jgi:endonuclease G
LTPSHAIGCVKRSNAFTADPQLQVGQRAEVSDYVKTGYDKGHIANDGDMGWDVTVERESFLMSNMTPQLPAFNRGIWKILEVTTRSWATDRQHTLVIYAGPIYSKDDKKIGDNAVDVPNGFYKIIIDTVTNDVLAFQFPHAGASNSDISPFQTTVSNIERATGITFSIPQRKDLKSPIWDYQISSAAKAKKKACSI